MKQTLLAPSIVLAIIALFGGCTTTPEDIPDTLTQPEYFQQAQEAVEVRDWDTALAYYEAAIERFPQDTETVVAAEYEIAFIAYKRGLLDEAAQGFRSVLERYDEGVGPQIPDWPKILSEKLLAEIEGEATREEG